MKNVFLLLATALLFTLSSGCVKSIIDLDSCDATLFSDDINPKLMAYQEALSTYSDDPTPVNCAAYKAAGQEWLDAIKSYESCTLLYTASWREAVDEAKAELDAEPCN
jgi:hypothetical protein